MLQRDKEAEFYKKELKRYRYIDRAAGMVIGVLVLAGIFFLVRYIYTLTTPPSLAVPNTGNPVKITSFVISKTQKPPAASDPTPSVPAVVFYEESDKTVFLIMQLSRVKPDDSVTVERYYNGAYLDSTQNIATQSGMVTFTDSWPVVGTESISTGVYLLKVYANGILIGAGAYEVRV